MLRSFAKLYLFSMLLYGSGKAHASVARRDDGLFTLTTMSMYDRYACVVDVHPSLRVYELGKKIGAALEERHAWIWMFHGEVLLEDDTKTLQEAGISAHSTIVFYIRRKPLSILEFIQSIVYIMDDKQRVQNYFFDRVILPNITLEEDPNGGYKVNRYLYMMARTRVQGGDTSTASLYTVAVADIEQHMADKVNTLAQGYVRRCDQAMPWALVALLAQFVYCSTYKRFVAEWWPIVNV